ncbi:MAG: hypothetical protein KAH30_06675 [Caldisericia bacterium]|nr:hypothetical protein [Caldisericia bacterium]
MKNKINTAYILSVILVITQLVYKVWVELPKSQDLLVNYWFVEPVFWSGTLGWAVLIPLMVMKNRIAFLVAGFAGILNGIVGLMFPLLGVCNHYMVGIVIFIHGLTIAYFSFRAYKKLE